MTSRHFKLHQNLRDSCSARAPPEPQPTAPPGAPAPRKRLQFHPARKAKDTRSRQFSFLGVSFVTHTDPIDINLKLTFSSAFLGPSKQIHLSKQAFEGKLSAAKTNEASGPFGNQTGTSHPSNADFVDPERRALWPPKQLQHSQLQKVVSLWMPLRPRKSISTSWVALRSIGTAPTQGTVRPTVNEINCPGGKQVALGSEPLASSCRSTLPSAVCTGAAKFHQADVWWCQEGGHLVGCKDLENGSRLAPDSLSCALKALMRVSELKKKSFRTIPSIFSHSFFTNVNISCALVQYFETCKNSECLFS